MYLFKVLIEGVDMISYVGIKPKNMLSNFELNPFPLNSILDPSEERILRASSPLHAKKVIQVQSR